MTLPVHFSPSKESRKWKKYVLLVVEKELRVSPESFPFTDKHMAALVNKIHREKVKHIW